MDAVRLSELKAQAASIAQQEFNESSLAATEAVLAVLAYEETLYAKHRHRQKAAYTWRMMREHGLINAVERVVQRDAETAGYQALKGMGLGDFAFESVVVRHREVFSEAAVMQSFRRLRELNASIQGAPSFWWVNHKQTHEDEIREGYIWSPTANRNGAKNQTYINLTRVEPGDYIISYADGLIRAIGRATGRYREEKIPENHWEAEGWDADGWMVPIAWVRLSSPIRPKSYIADIAPHLPGKYSPLQPNGNGNQGCYLASVSRELGELILTLVEEDAALQLSLASVTEEERKEAEQILAVEEADLTETEKTQLGKARVGQGLFRLRVLQIEPRCRITGVQDPAFLIASHIKPWRECDNFERLDGLNGLMLAPHIDKLFDCGWISFENNGDLIVAEGASSILEAWKIDPALNVGAFSKEQAAYLNHHRDFILKRNRKAD
ncbi:HNH endonuclease [Ectopseudomonas khazarica]|uniref:HNH endonuclease n=1 Tax=Ectopseudomonas khazarica TaxID=2502979 RepID=UPI00384FAC53